MSTYSSKKLIVTIALTLFLGTSFVATTKWAVDMSFFRTMTTRTTQTHGFAPEFGNLTLAATLITDNEVLLNLTFLGIEPINYPGMVWTLWVSKTIVGPEASLPEGLTLVEGLLKLNTTCPVPNRFLSLQAKLRAVADGKWIVYGLSSATHGPGLAYGLSTLGIEITVSNGRIVQLEQEPEPHPQIPNSGENKPNATRT